MPCGSRITVVSTGRGTAGEPPGHWPALLSILGLCTVAAVGLGVLVGLSARGSRVVAMLGLNVAAYLFFLGGGFATVAFLPDWLKVVCRFVPTSYAIEGLRQVVTVADVIAYKTLELRFDMLAMSDAMRGFLLSPGKAEHDRKKQADMAFAADIEDIRLLAPEGEIASLLQRAAETVRTSLGPVAILVNNAGITGRAARTWELTRADLDGVLAVNVVGPFLWCRAVLPMMLQARYGRIVNVASIAGKEGNPTLGPYSASKAALIALTKSMAKEVVGQGDVTVNAVSPGLTRPACTAAVASAESPA